jgi:hypothetical protein
MIPRGAARAGLVGGQTISYDGAKIVLGKMAGPPTVIR